MKNILNALLSGMGASVIIGILALVDFSNNNIALLMAPFGATAVLVFGVPTSPLAQAKNVVFGHLITAFIGVFFVAYVGVSPFNIALATGLSITVMMLTKTTHPPAGANPILIMLTSQTWDFLIFPVLIGALIIVTFGKAYNYGVLFIGKQ